VLRILARESKQRVFFFALNEIAAEQQRCERVLGLLLPPTLVSPMRDVVVEAVAGPGASTLGTRSGRTTSSVYHAGMESVVIDVVSVGEERFAEAYQSASVLFAEGGGFAALTARAAYIVLCPTICNQPSLAPFARVYTPACNICICLFRFASS